MIAEAEMADRHRAQTGRAHPKFGNGSLMASARRRELADEPFFDDADYCACVVRILTALIARASRTRN